MSFLRCIAIVAWSAVTIVPAYAKCFLATDAQQPSEAVFADGQRANVVSRTLGHLRYTIQRNNKMTLESEVQEGFFTSWAHAGGTTTNFAWNAPVPRLNDLSVGQSHSRIAIMKTEGKTNRRFAIKITVLAAEDLSVGNCSYPVLKILQETKIDSGPTQHITRYFNVPSMITLKNLQEIGSSSGSERQQIEHRVVELN